MTKNKFLATIILTSVCLITALAIFKTTNIILADEIKFTIGSKYEDMWKRVLDEENKGLYKNAADIVETIFEKSKKENNHPQIVKAIIYKTKYVRFIEEDALNKNIAFVKTEISKAKFPVKPVLETVLAEMYWSYYQQNRYKLYNRTNTVNFSTDDLATWDASKIIEAASKYYLLSIANEDSLKRTNIKLFDEVLNVGFATRNLRPTLYDFVAHRAVDFFSNSETELTKPAYVFKLNSEDYYSPFNVFGKYNIESKDSSSFKLYAIKIYQSLLNFHSSDSLPDALIDADIKRLKFVHTYSTLSDNDSLYLFSLENLEKRFIKYSASTEAGFEIASLYSGYGAKYTGTNDDKNKWMYKKAVEKCEEEINRFPKSFGTENCKNLISRIKQQQMNFNIEKVNFANKPSLSLLKYKNLKKIYLRLCRVDKSKFGEDVDYNYGEELIKKYLQLSIVTSWSVDLPDDGDYQNHSIELKIPEAAFGKYVLLSSNNPEFNYTDKKGVAYCDYWSSNIAYSYRKKDDYNYEFYVLDRISGAPIKNATAQLWVMHYSDLKRKNYYAKEEKYVTDDNGRFTIPKPKNYRNFEIQFINGEDELHSDNNFYQDYYSYNNYNENDSKTFFFTDRSIYRPGQIVYFKGIMLQTNGQNENKILAKQQTTVRLLDVNYQEISSIELTSNEYGSINGSFTIPAGVLNGQMHIENGDGTVYFSVEEYKRPKFEVTANPVKGSYRLGDNVKITGKAASFAGANIDGAAVKYRVVRNASFPHWGWYYWRSPQPTSPEMEITNGATTTNDTGGFFVDFKLIADDNISKSFDPQFSYMVYVDVIDINGETRSTTQTVSASYKALNLSINIAGKINKENVTGKFLIATTNMSGEFEPSNGTINIYKLQSPTQTFRKRYWESPEKQMMSNVEFSKNFPYDEYADENEMRKWQKQIVQKRNYSNVSQGKYDSVSIAVLKNLQPGYYCIEAETKDKYNEPVKYMSYFTVYAPSVNKMSTNEINFFEVLNPICEVGENAKILIGTAETNVKALYEVEYKGKIIKSEWMNLSMEQKLIEIPVDEKLKGGFTVSVSFVKNGRAYNNKQTITVPFTDKMLDIEFETFRDKLLPGQTEEWKIKIKGKKGDKVTAEMLASMYDASLDEFKSHNWYFNVYSQYYSYNSLSSGSFLNGSSNLYSKQWSEYSYINSRSYDKLNWFGANSYYYGWDYENSYRGGYNYEGDATLDEVQIMKDGDKSRNKSGETKPSGNFAPPPPPSPEGSVTITTKNLTGTMNSNNDAVYQLSTGNNADVGGKKTDLSNVKARTNLNETAFFYPDLNTDENGNVVIKFTAPEALTKWKLMTFGHTKDLKYGMAEKEVITQKELMVVPNLPRFFREGDLMTITAKINNLSGKTLAGSAELILLDAITQKDITHKIVSAMHGNFPTIGYRDFNSEKGKSAVLDWELKIPDGMGAVSVKIVAKAGNYSDGEQTTVPVLTNRMLVTETMPLYVKSNQTKTFTFEKFISQNGNSSTLKNHKLTFEFTSNPAWYAIQSLPYLIEYPYECAEQTFSRYYANSIASHIANSSPKIKAIFDAWKNSSPDAFLSNLEKNQELKSLLLEETPWVLDAKDESERKKRIALLFDLNRMGNELNKALNKLINMQRSNGGFPWFEGMPDDRYITQHIITGMGHLDKLGVKNVRENSQVWNMVYKGVKYLDDRITEDYKWIMKHSKNPEENHLSNIQIQYLYARSYFKDVAIDNSDKKAFDYFMGQAKKYWLQNGKYMQGMIALGLNRYNDKTTATSIIKSLNQTALHSEEMGMYWKENYEGLYWYESPIETQALLIEAFDEVANDKNSVDDLRVWLLKSKQTQNWKTTKATTEACYALLIRGTDWLATATSVEIVLGSQKLDLKQSGIKQEEGTGYFKTSWTGSAIKTDMGKVTVTKKDNGISWGAMYWQYFEQLDKITPSKTPLQLTKKLFIVKNSDKGEVLSPINENTIVKIGDKVKVRIELRVDRDMEYVHMKDMRASGFEPANVISQYKYQGGLGYYESTKDAATNFFFSYLSKGTYVFEYPLIVAHSGNFSNGITSIQCMYAPEFTSNSEGIRVKISK
jgi:uncharacterized protein YfaS (alpha-2-macroglobulin family)